MTHQNNINPNHITDEKVFTRRKFLAGAMALGLSYGFFKNRYFEEAAQKAIEEVEKPLDVKPGPQTEAINTALTNLIKHQDYLTDPIDPRLETEYKASIKYNNAYEFGTGKKDPYIHGRHLKSDPWTIEIVGSKNDGIYDLEKLVKLFGMEERVYRMRCVEAWSMIIPWDGVPLHKFIKHFGGENKKYVNFHCIGKEHFKKIGLNPRGSLHWPYRETLRMDEAMNDLTFATFGSYGKILTPQNGAPLKINIPWKYGFKSPKFVTKIEFIDSKEETYSTWNEAARHEYGFYSNVVPTVPHNRWSQATERLILKAGDVFTDRVPTTLYNGYAEQVQHMYPGQPKDYF